jgi:hypothetical protein
MKNSIVKLVNSIFVHVRELTYSNKKHNAVIIGGKITTDRDDESK